MSCLDGGHPVPPVLTTKTIKASNDQVVTDTEILNRNLVTDTTGRRTIFNRSLCLSFDMQGSTFLSPVEDPLSSDVGRVNAQ